MTKKQKEQNEITEYVSLGEAQLHRKYKTKIVEKTITQIESRDGAVTSKSLLEEASTPGHPLHDYFEWDDRIAGPRYRLAQASCMIAAVKYVVKIDKDRENQKPQNVLPEAQKKACVRKMLPLADQSGFADRKVVLNDSESRRSMIERKLGVLRSWCQSVIDIEELSNVRKAVQAALPN